MSFAKLFLFPSLQPLPPFYCVVRLLHSYQKILILLGFTFKSTCLWTILNVLPMKAGLSPIIWRLQIKFPKTQTGISDKHYLLIAKASEVPPKGQLSNISNYVGGPSQDNFLLQEKYIIWVNFPRTGKIVKMWHFFIFLELCCYQTV